MNMCYDACGYHTCENKRIYVLFVMRKYVYVAMVIYACMYAYEYRKQYVVYVYK